MTNIYLSKTRYTSLNKVIESIATEYHNELKDNKTTTVNGLLNHANAHYSDVLSNSGLDKEELCIIFANLNVLKARIIEVLELGYFVGDAYESLHVAKVVCDYGIDLCYVYDHFGNIRYTVA